MTTIPHFNPAMLISSSSELFLLFLYLPSFSLSLSLFWFLKDKRDFYYCIKKLISRWNSFEIRFMFSPCHIEIVFLSFNRNQFIAPSKLWISVWVCFSLLHIFVTSNNHYCLEKVVKNSPCLLNLPLQHRMNFRIKYFAIMKYQIKSESVSSYIDLTLTWMHFPIARKHQLC